MKLITASINTNIYISLAAVFLTIASQIQLGMSPQWYPYLFLIFFATLFEYNLHRMVTILTNKEALLADKHQWLRENLPTFYILMLFSLLGFMVTVFFAKKEVLLTLTPIAFLTIFYSLPLFKTKNASFRLREIPFLKIFLIAFVWAASTILLPLIATDKSFQTTDIILLFIERFLFIFAITIPFDIRDMEADQQAGLKTLPILLTEEKSIFISNLSLILFFLISYYHYQKQHEWFIISAVAISTISTLAILNSKKIRSSSFYHYGFLDGTMLFQGVLMLVANYVKHYTNF